VYKRKNLHRLCVCLESPCRPLLALVGCVQLSLAWQQSLPLPVLSWGRCPRWLLGAAYLPGCSGRRDVGRCRSRRAPPRPFSLSFLRCCVFVCAYPVLGDRNPCISEAVSIADLHLELGETIHYYSRHKVFGRCRYGMQSKPL
jgi:hypothetical protein